MYNICAHLFVHMIYEYVLQDHIAKWNQVVLFYKYMESRNQVGYAGVFFQVRFIAFVRRVVQNASSPTCARSARETQGFFFLPAVVNPPLEQQSVSKSVQLPVLSNIPCALPSAGNSKHRCNKVHHHGRHSACSNSTRSTKHKNRTACCMLKVLQCYLNLIRDLTEQT